MPSDAQGQVHRFRSRGQQRVRHSTTYSPAHLVPPQLNPSIRILAATLRSRRKKHTGIDLGHAGRRIWIAAIAGVAMVAAGCVGFGSGKSTGGNHHVGHANFGGERRSFHADGEGNQFCAGRDVDVRHQRAHHDSHFSYATDRSGNGDIRAGGQRQLDGTKPESWTDRVRGSEGDGNRAVEQSFRGGDAC